MEIRINVSDYLSGEEIKDLRERRHKILKSLSLFSLIKSWWNLKK